MFILKKRHAPAHGCKGHVLWFNLFVVSNWSHFLDVALQVSANWTCQVSIYYHQY